MPQGYRNSRTLSQAEFEAIKNKVLDALPAGLSEEQFKRRVGPAMEAALAEAEYTAPASEGGPVGRFVGAAASMLNPVAAAQGIYQAARHPIDTAGQIYEASSEQGRQALEAARGGRYVEAAGHAAGMIPLIGPAAVQAGERIAEGDIAGGLGQGVGLLAPMGAPSVIRGVAARMPGRAAVAAGLEQRGINQLRQAITPQVGPNKLRFATKAEKIAPDLIETVAKEPGAWTPEGFHAQVGEHLTAAEEALDAASDARLNARTFATKPLIDDLMKKRQAMTAEAVEASHPIPEVRGGPQRVMQADPGQRYALQWMQEEMESFPFVKRTFNEAPLGHGGDLEVTPGAAGARIYREVVGPVGSPRIHARRSDVLQAIKDVYAGNTKGELRQYVAEVADELASGRLKAQGTMETPGPVPSPESLKGTVVRDISGTDVAPEIERVGVPLGRNVVPSPRADRVAVIDQAIAELKALGPVTRYEPLRTIRMAYDQPAKIKYNPSLTQDFLKVQGKAEGAADVTGVLREHLAKMDPQTAAANVDYSLFKSADDVMTALTQGERARPKMFRRVMTRLASIGVGGQAAGVPGAIAGAILGPALEASSVTTKFQRARLYARFADAIRKGDEGLATSLAVQIRRLGAQGAVLQGRTTSPSESQSPAMQPTGMQP